MQSGVKAFVVYRKKVLLVKRENKPNIRNPNTWGFPGGGIDSGENDLDALKRELKEEINIVPKDILFLGKEAFQDGSYVSRYLVKIDENEKRKLKIAGEGQRMDFFAFKDIFNLPISAAARKYLSQHEKRLKIIIEEGERFTPQEIGLE